MSVTLSHEGVDKLKTVLKQHFDKFIEYHLHDMITNMSIDSSFFGIEFLPIERKVYLKIQSILRRLEVRLPSLKQTFFLYRDQIIWSGLSQDDTTLLYSFFRRYYWPNIKTLCYTSAIRYLTVNTSVHPLNGLIISTNLISQEFYLEDSSLPYRIIVINLNLFTIFCVFYFDEYLPDNEQMSSTIESFQKDLNSLLFDFEECSQQKYPIIDQTVKTVYFNRINSAIATTIDWHREPHNTIGTVMNTLAEDLQWLDSAGEVMVKRENDPWIIVKRSDMRELILTINHKNANLKEISEKIKQIFSTQFNNIFVFA
jgi:hypothetical protein